MPGWDLASVEPLTMTRTNRLANMYVLSPYVWRGEDLFHLLVRAVPRRDDEPRLKMAEIWHGTSSDGRHFDMENAPVIFPGPDAFDLDGCEDPTVHVDGGTVRLWYTGYNEKQKTGRLILARGPDVAQLAKAGVAIDSSPAFANPKEASIATTGAGHWRMFFEYALNRASLIGQAVTNNLDGPWRDVSKSALLPRPGRWDGWHVSPGPVLGEGSQRPTMFYNGATEDAAWRIGWATFDRSLIKVVNRCEEPLIVPEPSIPDGASDIAFAASAVDLGDHVLLYFAQSDRDLRCAAIRARE